MPTANEWLTYPNGTDEQLASDYAQNIIKIASVINSALDVVNGGLLPRIVEGPHLANQSVGERVLRDNSIYGVKLADLSVTDGKIAHDQSKVRKILTFGFTSIAEGVFGVHEGQTTSAVYGPIMPCKMRIVSLHFINSAGTKWTENSINYGAGYAINALGSVGVEIATIDTIYALRIWSDNVAVVNNIEFASVLSGSAGIATIELEVDDGL